mmetsp:Transcript_13251/g.39492  ORF Transcript_13251/g.39492 Transcript_13251/m.39492 type:complete len:214 (-) Transcript_13251:289-930(-)
MQRSQAATRVELQEALHQVQRLQTLVREDAVQRPGRRQRQGLQHRRGIRALHRLDVFEAGQAGQLQDPVNLIQGAHSWERRPPSQKLTEDAPQAPQVHGAGVGTRAEQYLRRPVPTSRDVVCHWPLARRRRRGDGRGDAELADGPGQSEIRELDVALGVDKDVRRLEVTMYQPRGMEELEALCDLVHDVLAVERGEGPDPDHAMQVRLHILEH